MACRWVTLRARWVTLRVWVTFLQARLPERTHSDDGRGGHVAADSDGLALDIHHEPRRAKVHPLSMKSLGAVREARTRRGFALLR